MTQDIIDFSVYGKPRQRFRLLDGNVYEMLNSIELGAAKTARLSRLGENSSELDMSNPDEAENIESNTREMVRILMPDIPSEVLDDTPFEVIAALAAFFAQNRIETERPMDMVDTSSLQDSSDSTVADPPTG